MWSKFENDGEDEDDSSRRQPASILKMYPIHTTKYTKNTKADQSTDGTARRSGNQGGGNRSKQRKQRPDGRHIKKIETPSRVLCSTAPVAVSPFSPFPHVQIPLGETMQFFNR